ncbi:MAG: DUF4395 domain-containing protein [Anaerolineae bacterium]|nr:DUF4395 domain-containing protein [Anaerolineae bacterium]MDW8101001.1 DUF4395 domain-containing protein [Anaerolineae bacterium]
MTTRMVDHTALRFNQASIILLLVLSFLADWPWLVTVVGLIMLVGTIWPGAGLFRLIYARVARPAGLFKPDMQPDEPEPHLFAQGVGGLFLLAATIGFALNAAVLGWVLAAVVVVLAAINLFWGFCLGCFFYYQLARLGVRAELPWWRGS